MFDIKPQRFIFRHPAPTTKISRFYDFTQARLTRTSRSKSSIENGNTRISVDSDVSFTTISSSCGSISRDTDIAVNVALCIVI